MIALVEALVMAGRGHETAAAAAQGHLRASNDDREHVVGMLKAAFVQGRISKDELDARMAQALAARTYADLAVPTADLPAGVADARPARARAQPPVGKLLLVGTAVIIPWALLTAIFLTGSEQLATLFGLVIPWYFIAFVVAGAQLLDSRRNHSRGQLPPRPEHPGRALGCERHRGTGQDLTLARARRDACGGGIARGGGIQAHQVIQHAWRPPPGIVAGQTGG